MRELTIRMPDHDPGEYRVAAVRDINRPEPGPEQAAAERAMLTLEIAETIRCGYLTGRSHGWDWVAEYVPPAEAYGLEESGGEAEQLTPATKSIAIVVAFAALAAIVLAGLTLAEVVS